LFRRFSINFALLSMAIDALVVAGSLRLASELRVHLDDLSFLKPLPSSSSLPVLLYLIFPLIWVLLLGAFSIYDGNKQFKIIDEVATLMIASFIAAISLAGVLYFSFRQISRALFLFFVIIAILGLLLWRALVRMYFRLNHDWPDVSRKILIVGTGTLGQKVSDQIEQAELGNILLLGFIDDTLASATQHADVLGGRDDIRKIVHQFGITDVVIALPHSVYQHLSAAVACLDDLPVRVWVALGFFDLALYKTGIADFAGIPMIDLRAPALNEYQRLTKRAFDLFVGSVLLILTFPLMAAVAAVIWLQDGSPILFRQQRVGENGCLFEMFKFRTMVKGAEKLRHQVERVDENGDLIHKIEHDPRITPLGKFFRRFSLDELPQLFNVLEGTMSLVGPRPELPYLVERYQPWQRKRFAIPPGITGWWQVSGRSDNPMHLHTEEDLFYVQNYSLFLDIRILLKTILVVLQGSGAY
jgi:exopolysaccharide biosynthesis polyprenyl glycosylphosphotransferase